MNILKNKMKLIVSIVIVGFFLWFLVIHPFMFFQSNEQKLEDAAKRYYEFNSSLLPTGERVATVSMETLFHQAFLDSDLYSPYSKKVCSSKNSWVKVRYIDGEYHYYTYLDCGGFIHSLIDHKGPVIRLNGENEMTVGLGEEFKDPGIDSIIDGKDGRISIDKATVRSEVDTKKIGSYTITYSAMDQLNNKTIVTRTVNVIQTLSSTIRPYLNGNTNFVGNPIVNYLRLSQMLFRVYGITEEGNIIVVAEEDVSNVNFSKLDSWLDYYYEHLNPETKKMIVDSQYCNMALSTSNLDTLQCNSYTKRRKVYIPSVVEVNKAAAGEENFMKTLTMSWVSNPTQDGKQAYLTRTIFFGDEYGKSFLPYDIKENYGVRPMFVIKGDSNIVSGNGTRDDPYCFDDYKKAHSGDYVNSRYTGEYILDSGVLWRIIDTLKDGTTKVISVATIGEDKSITCFPNPETETILYNPKDKMSVAYYINNTIPKYVDTSHFVEHEINVPVYKNRIIYGEETKTNHYKVVLSAPNMYEMFSAQTKTLIDHRSFSYWLLNSSESNRLAGSITDIGVPLNERIPEYYSSGVRVVAFLNKDTVVSTGKGTEQSPYKIK